MASEEEGNTNAYPKLTKLERLELHNFLLKINVDVERINKHRLEIQNAEERIQQNKYMVKQWNERFGQKLKKLGFDINKVAIDAETGEIFPQGKHFPALTRMEKSA